MKEPLRTIVYRQLLEMIVSCELAPNSFVNEDMLMEFTGTSRTPVREAVQKLEGERFVRVFPKRGIYVCELSSRGLREIFEIRRLIEPFIIRQYGMRIPRDDTARYLDELKAAMEAEDLDACDTVDGKMHLQLVAANSNVRLSDLLVQMYDHSRRYMTGADVRDYASHRESYEYSAQTLECILEGSYEEAAAALERHLNSTEQIISGAMVAGNG